MNLSQKLKGLEPKQLWIYGPNISNYPSPVLRTIGADELIVVDRASYDRMKAIAMRLAEAINLLNEYSGFNNYPEHEVRHTLCCEIPQIGIDAQGDCAKLLEGEK